jgi:hypothetical protein
MDQPTGPSKDQTEKKPTNNDELGRRIMNAINTHKDLYLTTPTDVILVLEWLKQQVAFHELVKAYNVEIEHSEKGGD